LNTYFHQLAGFRRSWAWAALAFSFGSVGSNLIGLETTPFFVWGMFSEPIQPNPPYYEHLRITANDQTLDYTAWDVSLFQRYLMINTFHYAFKMSQTEIDPTRQFVAQKLGTNYHYIEPLTKQVTNELDDLNGYVSWHMDYINTAFGLHDTTHQVWYQYLDPHTFQLVAEFPCIHAPEPDSTSAQTQPDAHEE
jgi:hypothetical protein